MTVFRLGLLNPNTNVEDTDAMVALAAAALGDAGSVVGATARRGHPSIEGEVEHVAGAAAVLESQREVGDVDAYLIACFGDPALHAARECTTAPVVGIGEAAYRAAAMVARRFAVLTTLPRGVPELWDGMRRYGVEHQCAGVIALGVGVGEQGSDAARAALRTAGARAVDELDAEALVLACGAMSSDAVELSAAIGVPVCDGVAFGALTAHALWRAGLRTSDRGSYAPPEGDAAGGSG